MWPQAEATGDKRRDAFMSVMRNHKVGFAFACHGKGIVPCIDNLRFLSELLAELRHEWPNHVVWHIDHRQTNGSALQGGRNKRTVDDDARDHGAGKGDEVHAFHRLSMADFCRASAVRLAGYYIIIFAGLAGRFWRRVPIASSGQSDSLRPPRQPVRRGFFCRRSYITSVLPQTAFIRRCSGEDGMPWISAAAIPRLEPAAGQYIRE